MFIFIYKEMKDLVYLFVIMGSVISTFFLTRINILGKINSLKEELTNRIVEIEKENERQKVVNENQQQVIDQFKKTISDQLPVLYKIINNFSKK